MNVERTRWLSSLAAVIVFAVRLGAQTSTYEYAGNHFTTATAPYTASQSVAGCFTTSAPLGANLNSVDISSLVQFFSFSAGPSTWNSTNSAYSGQRVSTDAQGHITAWLFGLYGASGAVNGLDLNTCSNIQPAQGGCGYPYDIIVNNNSPPGIWSGPNVGSSNGVPISATPMTLSLQAAPGTSPPFQPLQISGTPGASWQATAATSTGGSWFSFSPAAGTIPGSLAVTVNSSGLQPGTYQGSITIQSSGGTASSTTVDVTLAVGGVTYTYEGNKFNYFFGPTGLTTSNSISASLTFASPLPNNFGGDPGGTAWNNLTPKDQILPLAWSISDQELRTPNRSPAISTI